VLRPSLALADCGLWVAPIGSLLAAYWPTTFGLHSGHRSVFATSTVDRFDDGRRWATSFRTGPLPCPTFRLHPCTDRPFRGDRPWIAVPSGIFADRSLGRHRPRSLRRETSVCGGAGVHTIGDSFATARWNVSRGSGGVEKLSPSATMLAPPVLTKKACSTIGATGSARNTSCVQHNLRTEWERRNGQIEGKTGVSDRRR